MLNVILSYITMIKVFFLRMKLCWLCLFFGSILDELKAAVLEISRARDAAEGRRIEVAAALTQEMETTSMLRAELALQQTQHQETLDKLDMRVNTLTRLVSNI